MSFVVQTVCPQPHRARRARIGAGAKGKPAAGTGLAVHEVWSRWQGAAKPRVAKSLSMRIFWYCAYFHVHIRGIALIRLA